LQDHRVVEDVGDSNFTEGRIAKTEEKQSSGENRSVM
jgi:hypothetical protein